MPTQVTTRRAHSRKATGTPTDGDYAAGAGGRGCALPYRASHRSDLVRCAPVPALSRLARRARSSSAPSKNRLRRPGLCRC
eukprot:scaffold117601_cov57-Phaeocystis_antarctica.AAC.4